MREGGMYGSLVALCAPSGLHLISLPLILLLLLEIMMPHDMENVKGFSICYKGIVRECLSAKLNKLDVMY
jgi:hypothetical protein